MTTRAEFFARLRAEVRRAPAPFPARTADRPARPDLVADTIRRELSERWPQTLERFQREFERVGGVLCRVATVQEVPEAVAGIARERGLERVVTWHPAALGADLAGGLAAAGLSPHAMPPGPLAADDERRRLRETIAGADLGLTGVDLAIAETGTLVLVSGGGRPRSTALLPPCHVAVLDRTALVESLAQAGVILEAWHQGTAPAERGAAIHFITGPSRTADIELTLTRGVHGPKEVLAVFVETPIRG
jgi:L-lactate dehydrogenase complex protein LldG